jgi:hypothetical protein
MSRPTNDVLKARAEASELLGFGDDPEALCAADRLKCDLVLTLRAAIDHASARLIDGNSTDLSRLITATESLIRLLPERQPAAPSQRDARGDAVTPLLKLFRHLHESVHTLSAENAQLKAQLAGGPASALLDVPELVESVPRGASTAIDPSLGDIVPPGERAECDVGPQRGLDDPLRRPPQVIEARAVPKPKPSPAPPAAPAAYDYNKERGWRDFVLPDGTITAQPMSRGRWWGPV